MKDSKLPPTTSCGQRSAGNRGQYDLESPPPAAHISQCPEIVGKQFGHVTIISPEKRWNKTWNHCYVLTKCEGCGTVQWTFFDNLKRGVSKGCQSCSQPRSIPKWLDRRLTAAKQRCTNPKDAGFANYGGRGIKFMFDSVKEAGLYLIETLGLPERCMEIDRIDVNGNYERGNLRWVTHQENCANQRRFIKGCTTSSTQAPESATP